MKGLTATLILVISIFTCHTAAGQLIITPQSNGQALAQKLVGNGVVISNVSLTADPRATGFFNNVGGTKIGIDSGILLTTGRAKTDEVPGWGVNGDAKKQAIEVLADNNLSMPGDGDLARLIGVLKTDIHDAAVLEFDFVPLGDTVKFNYVFGSEEYPDYVCQFNDVFAFFINGPGFPGPTNIALIPGTTDAVTINHVNDGAACSVFYPQYYIRNYTNTYFTYNGHTTVLTAVAQVQPCQTYHLKLAIADAGDFAFDSGVFLEAKSLSSNVVTLTNTTQVDAQNNSYLVEGCSAGSFKVTRPEASIGGPLAVSLLYSGTAINGVDYQLLPNTVIIPPNQTETVVNIIPIIDNLPEGIETLKIYALAGCNGNPSDSTIIQIRDYDTLGIAPDTAVICKNASIQLVATAGYTTYQWDANPTLTNTSIRNPFATPVNPSTTYYCTATEGTCHGRDSAFIRFKDLDFVSKKEINCKNDATGEIKVAGGPEWTRPAQYSINNNPYQADSTFSNLPVGTYTVRIKDADGCIDSMTVVLTQLYPDLVITDAKVVSATCLGGADGTITVSVSGGNNPYLFSSDGINFQTSNIFNLLTGNYTITVKDNNNCSTDRPVVLPLNNSVTLDAGIDLTICEGKSAQLKATSNADALLWTPAATLNDNTLLNPEASPVVTTKYFVTATTGICTRKDSAIVFVNPAPKANAGPDQKICYGQNAQLQGAGGLTYLWSPTSYLDDHRSASPVAAKLPGSISYYLHVTDINGCVSLKKDTVLITVVRPAILFVGNDTTLAVGQPMQLHSVDVNNIGLQQYTWSPAYGLDNPFINDPITVLDHDVVYTVTASNAIGCTAVDEIKIKVYRGPEIYVPNAFSPNGDGLNDLLKAIPVGIKDFHYFRIFNRWGNIVFATQNYTTGWDGKIKGGLQTPGTTYVWIAEGVDYKGNTIQRKGTVIITN
ncbi:choice-of-anchor L domain-containing protein [Ferruginibacter sp.]